MAVLIPLSGFQASVSAANTLFNQRPHIKLTAIRDGPHSYTIVRKGHEDAFVAPAIPPRINIRELRDRMALRMRQEEIMHHRQHMNGMEQQQLSEFINRTLMNHAPRPTPLPTNVLNDLKDAPAESFPDVVGDKCPICLDNFAAGEKVIQLQCGHVSHSACLRRWFTEKDTCPHCRAVPRMQIRTAESAGHGSDHGNGQEEN